MSFWNGWSEHALLGVCFLIAIGQSAHQHAAQVTGSGGCVMWLSLPITAAIHLPNLHNPTCAILNHELSVIRSSCPFDYVRVYDGPSNDSEPIGSYCGQWTDVAVYSTSDSMYMEFVTKSGRSEPFVRPFSRSDPSSAAAGLQRRGFKASFDITDQFVDLGNLTSLCFFFFHIRCQLSWVISHRERSNRCARWMGAKAGQYHSITTMFMLDQSSFIIIFSNFILFFVRLAQQITNHHCGELSLIWNMTRLASTKARSSSTPGRSQNDCLNGNTHNTHISVY